MKVRLFLLFSLHFVTSSRDYYVGMFKKNDLLVATDTLYKDRKPFGMTRAMYGRLFKCDITYFRVVDRLGVGRVPRVEITRGGLQMKYVVLRITSGYDLPLSVNIYVGCENKYNHTLSTKIIRRTKPTTPTTRGIRSTANDTTTAKSNDEKEEKKEDTTAPKATDDKKPDDANANGEAAKGDGETAKDDKDAGQGDEDAAKDDKDAAKGDEDAAKGDEDDAKGGEDAA